jgi:Protein of unknown function (DUF1488)
MAEDEAILFCMFDSEDRIVCRVDWAALRDRAVADGTDTNDIARTFEKHRRQIERGRKRRIWCRQAAARCSD